jgi:hypothetical protein
MHYYRLRQVDLDGTSTFGPVRSINLAAGTTPPQLTVAPNPTTADNLQLQVQYSGLVPAATVLETHGLLGQQVLAQRVTLQPGANSLSLATSLAPGLYWLTLTGDAANGSKAVKVLLTN